MNARPGVVSDGADDPLFAAFRERATAPLGDGEASAPVDRRGGRVFARTVVATAERGVRPA